MKRRSKKITSLIVLTLSFVFVNACRESAQLSENTLFTNVSATETGIKFSNSITETKDKNYLKYYYFYNGSGVAVGDINNDGLDDIYFGSNQGENKLYLNEGDLKFKDITISSGVGDKDSWTTGVSMVDINNDGYLDIYVCNGGPEPDLFKRSNRLFINNKDLTFTESAEKYGLNLPTFSIQAYFFDYDRDDDLDMYLVNHRIDWTNNNQLSKIMDRSYERETSDYLFRNDGDEHFTDVTFESGIINKAWGLSASIGDFNNDGWEDIYVANDFVQADYLYINNEDGTFTNRINDFMAHSSNYSMGSDLADIDNDGLLDLVVADMVPEGHIRSKRLMFSMNTQYFQNLIDYYGQRQYMSNALQLNNGKGLFSEIGQYAGINKTDWSWATLLADFDQDGMKDLLVTNGIKRDITDNDYAVKMINQSEANGSEVAFEDVLNNMPSTKVPNYIFRNTGDLKFENSVDDWGFDKAVNSNGVAYGDFDDDGDLDLAINNIDDQAGIYVNQGDSPNYLKIRLKGPDTNIGAIGAKVYVRAGEMEYFQQNYLARGYMSSVTNTLHFGLGKDSVANSILVVWPDSTTTELFDINAGQKVLIEYQGGEKFERKLSRSMYSEVDPKDLGIEFIHQENDFDDFKSEILLPHIQSKHGPFMSKGDINGDGKDDFFIGGAAGQPGEVYVQTIEGKFIKTNQSALIEHQDHEDMKSLFFDADNDSDLDLYVVSGGVEFPIGDYKYQDRLYLNNGSGEFTYSESSLPEMLVSGLKVAGSDIDQDGDIDLFVGGRNVPGRYPIAPQSFILINENGRFLDKTTDWTTGFESLGMVNDAVFKDLNGDDQMDLIVAGEWMPISIFLQENNKFINRTIEYGLSSSTGWWMGITIDDINNDGLLDIIAGNMGGNNKYKPSLENPLHVYGNDMDQSGSFDIVLSKKWEGELVPVRGRSCASEQMPFIKEKFETYEAYANASLADIFDESALLNATHYIAEILESAIFIQQADSFVMKKLPARAQLGPLRTFIEVENANYISVGNYYGTEVETVSYDSPNAVMFNINGESIDPLEHGIFTRGDTRDMIKINSGVDQLIIISRNNDSPLIYRLNP